MDLKWQNEGYLLLAKIRNNAHFPMCFPSGLSLSNQANGGFGMQLKLLLRQSPRAGIT